MKLKTRISLSFIFLIIQSTAVLAQSFTRELKWKNPIEIEVTKGEKLRSLNFEGANYNEKNIPYFFENLKINGKPSGIEASLSNAVYEELKDKELLGKAENILNMPEVTASVQYMKKEAYASVAVFPFRKNSSSGIIERLVSFELVLKPNYAAKLGDAARTYASSSVLSNGTWYKVAVASNGIFKMDNQFLQSLGINTSSLDPRNIKVYGNGGGMLPFANASFRYDDLQENAIYVEGESDGVFNASDYVLFYGQSPTKWAYNQSTKKFNHQVNLYADYTYYFINVDPGFGKRIQNISSGTATPTQYVASFDDYSFHEADLVNLIKSGREWYGESVDLINNTLSFDFNFPNRIVSDSVYVKSQVVGRSQSQPNTFTLNVNGINRSSVTITTVPQVYYLDYGYEYPISSTFISASSLIKTLHVFSSSDNTATGWLNFVEVNVRRALNFSGAGNQMEFRDARSVGIGSIAEYSVANTNSNCFIWDITDPINVLKQQATLNGTTLTFNRDADTLRQFVVANGSSFPSPISVGNIANQDLHSLPHADFLIVTHPDFLSAANKLAQFHRDMDSMVVHVVTTTQVFNEFSCGGQDVSAIRDFVKMFYDRAQSNTELPRYLLLFGDGSYDNKNRFSPNTNYVTTYESANSLNLSNSYVSDDFFGLLDDNEGQWNPNENDLLDIGIGRLPVKSLSEANDMVNKIIIYASPDKESGHETCVTQSASAFGDWRNLMAFVADDEDWNTHLNQSQYLADSLTKGTHPVYNVDKIYLDAYKQQSTPGGDRYPDAQDAIVKRVQRGALLVTYVGHGGELGWAQERVLENSDILGWTNLNTLPAFLTATCEFSRVDDPARTSAGEYVLLNANGGGIGLFTTTRLAYSSSNFSLAQKFLKHFFPVNGIRPAMGDILARAKIESISLNTRNFFLLGDPALTLNYPIHQVVTSAINQIPVSGTPDTLSALSKVTISGFIADRNGNKLNNFNGVLYPTVFDKANTFYTLANDPGSSYVTTFILQKNALHRGKVSVVNGEFSFTFIVPKDISFQLGKGKISYYAHNGKEDAHGYYENVIIGGVNTSAYADPSGPDIKLYLNDEKFVFGGTTNANPILLAYVKDTSGINTIGNGIGHDITAKLDDNNEKLYVLNDYYESDTNSYQQGKISYSFNDLSEGRHTLKLKVWDVYNNSSEAYLEFVVASSSAIALNHVLNYPNPFSTHTTFLFEHNKPCTTLDVQVQVFSISGKLIKTIQQKIYSEGFRSEDVEWDGLDDFGNKIGRGAYVYKLRVKSPDGAYADKIEKLVILR